MAVSAHDVARELRKRLPGSGVAKIHKLLYYCQGWHLAFTGQPMFREDLEPWAMGPVVADLWHDEDKRRTPPPAEELDVSAVATLAYVVSRYGRLTGIDLIHLSHAEDPWLKASDNPWSLSISYEALAGFFRSDEEVARASELADRALADERILSLVDEARTRVDESTGTFDDPAEIRRRLLDLTG